MQISQGFVEELKYRNRIDDVISSYVNLKRAGSNKVGLCPFHSEKTPSFTVFSNTETFKCFGCGAGGDVISFTMLVVPHKRNFDTILLDERITSNGPAVFATNVIASSPTTKVVLLHLLCFLLFIVFWFFICSIFSFSFVLALFRVFI